MKYLHIFTQSPRRTAGQARQTVAAAGAIGAASPTSRILIGLMMPAGLIILNEVIFNVALPTIRDDFAISADVSAWVVTAYLLPYVMLMPLYGRLGDGLGKRRLLLLGLIVFLVGTAIGLLAPTLGLLMLGRVIQGVGAAGVNPLCMALISERFPAHERGKALGTWNSVGPAVAQVGPLIGGVMVDQLSWQSIFGPIFLLGLSAVAMVKRLVPPAERSFIQPGFLRSLDWGGVTLLGGTVMMLIFFVSSRPITGVAALQDWRLLALALLFLAGFITWEKRQTNPFVRLAIFANRSFDQASVGSGIRMFILSSLSFLIPLYLADVHDLSATAIGLLLLFQAGALFVTMRRGGQLADRWGSRRPVIIGSLAQFGVMIYFALLPGSAWPGWVAVGLIGHGLGAGLSLAALHRAALEGVDPEQTGMAAGLYSMIRFGGSAIGTALAGVILQFGLDRSAVVVSAFQLVFWFMAGVALLGVATAWGLRD